SRFSGVRVLVGGAFLGTTGECKAPATEKGHRRELLYAAPVAAGNPLASGPALLPTPAGAAVALPGATRPTPGAVPQPARHPANHLRPGATTPAADARTGPQAPGVAVQPAGARRGPADACAAVPGRRPLPPPR